MNNLLFLLCLVTPFDYPPEAPKGANGANGADVDWVDDKPMKKIECDKERAKRD